MKIQVKYNFQKYMEGETYEALREKLKKRFGKVPPTRQTLAKYFATDWQNACGSVSDVLLLVSYFGITSLDEALQCRTLPDDGIPTHPDNVNSDNNYTERYVVYLAPNNDEAKKVMQSNVFLPQDTDVSLGRSGFNVGGGTFSKELPFVSRLQATLNFSSQEQVLTITNESETKRIYYQDDGAAQKVLFERVNDRLHRGILHNEGILCLGNPNISSHLSFKVNIQELKLISQG